MEDLEYILNYLNLKYEISPHSKSIRNLNHTGYVLFSFYWISWNPANPYRTMANRILYCYGKI